MLGQHGIFREAPVAGMASLRTLPWTEDPAACTMHHAACSVAKKGKGKKKEGPAEDRKTTRVGRFACSSSCGALHVEPYVCALL